MLLTAMFVLFATTAWAWGIAGNLIHTWDGDRRYGKLPKGCYLTDAAGINNKGNVIAIAGFLLFLARILGPNARRLALGRIHGVPEASW